MSQSQSQGSGLPVPPEALRRKFAAVRRWQAIGRAVTLLAVVVVVGEFYGYYKATDGEVRANFADTARNQKAVEEALPKLTPVLQTEFTKVATEVGPVYRRMAFDRYQQAREKLTARVTERFHKLPEEGGALLSENLVKSFDKVIKRIEPELAAAFPNLTEEQRRDLLIHHFDEAVTKQNEILAGKLASVHSEETDRIQTLLAKFSIPEAAGGKSEEQMHQELVRTLTLLAARELESFANAPTAAPAAIVPAVQTADTK